MAQVVDHLTPRAAEERGHRHRPSGAESLPPSDRRRKRLPRPAADVVLVGSTTRRSPRAPPRHSPISASPSTPKRSRASFRSPISSWSRLPRRSWPGPGCSSWMRQPRRSTAVRSSSSSRLSAAYATRARRSSSSLTVWKRSSRSPTASRSSRTASTSPPSPPRARRRTIWCSSWSAARWRISSPEAAGR